MQIGDIFQKRKGRLIIRARSNKGKGHIVCTFEVGSNAQETRSHSRLCTERVR